MRATVRKCPGGTYFLAARGGGLPPTNTEKITHRWESPMRGTAEEYPKVAVCAEFDFSGGLLLVTMPAGSD